VTGTDAFHPEIEQQPGCLHLARGCRSVRARCSLGIGKWLVVLFLLGPLCDLMGPPAWQSVLPGWTRHSVAADVSLPAPSPHHTIHIQADTLAHQTRGSYDLLAFRGQCQLRQGELTATCQDLVVWVERALPRDPQTPRKYICTMEGDVTLQWDGQPALRDSRWMGHLFSFQEIAPHVHEHEKRTDIPKLDWSRDSAGGVMPAQYAQPVPQSGTGANSLPSPGTTGAAPPLLMQNTLPAPRASGAAAANPAVPGNLSGGVVPGVPSLPGATPWPADNAIRTPNGIPSSGLVIPEDGSQPYPAAGVAPPPAPPTSVIAAQPVSPTAPVGAKMLTLNQRSSTRSPSFNFTSRPEFGDSVATITGGIILSISGVATRQADGTMLDLGNVSIETDNAVIWISGNTDPNILSGLQSTADRPIELYLEGNIVLHQGQRVIYAERMYYNVSSEYGMVLSAEILTPVPQYQGLLRLKADVVEQRNRQNFLAHGAAVTSSRLGVPRYWLQADRVQFEDIRPEGSIDMSRAPGLSEPTNMQATSRNNFVYLGGVPIGYWPIFTTNLATSNYYVSSITAQNDRIFGTQVYVDLDMYQLLGMKGPEGTDWKLSTDYLSKRGPALGTHFDMDRPNFLWAGPTRGFFDAWGIQDSGLDTLGSDRVNMVPEATRRGWAIGRFRNMLTPNIEFWSELGYITDRNFLEQYFENNWDQQPDYSTQLRLRHYEGNKLFDIWGSVRLNDFFTETNWWPRVDHYWLGQQLGDYFYWSEHTSVGYAKQQIATVPTAPEDRAKFTYLPWETDSEGVRAVTRQEISAPVALGPWKVTPFLSGEVGYWGEDITNNPLTRLTGQGGVRTTLPLWRASPNWNSSLFDINGLAHKVTLDSELFYADSTQNVDSFPLYDPLDDNSQEHFRRRMIFNTFGGSRPPRFDERNYAVRQGLQRYVTASSMEVVDDMTQARMGINQRWQTKRGTPGRERIVDLVALDVDWIYYPNADRDNWGEDIGAINYDFRYNIGDRLSLLSDGYFDTFSQGLKAISAGAMISRPGLGDAYIGLLSLEGPISSNVLNGYVNYRMNEKWILSGGAAYDFGSVGNIGQTLTLARIGESALIQVGIDIDSGRDNVVFNFNIEPRFLPFGRIGTVGGQLIPPAGLNGVE